MYEERKMHWYDKERMKKERQSLAGEVENPPGGGTHEPARDVREALADNQIYENYRNSFMVGQHSDGGRRNFDGDRQYSGIEF